jgi:hypothetical protein
MTSNAAIIYISFLLNMFKGKKIGLIWDKHTSHYSNEVLEFIKKCNEEATSSTSKIVLEKYSKLESKSVIININLHCP